MPSAKRRVADLVERALGVRLVRPRDLPILYEQEFLGRFLREFAVDAVFDVGANLGQYARMLRQRTGFKGAIISCEPIPELAARLREQADADPFWYVEELALSDEAGEAMFNVMTSDAFSSLLLPRNDQAEAVANRNKVERQVRVRLDTLESVFDKYQDELGFQRPFLKVDTQGHDVAVVRGAGDRVRQLVGLQTELAVRLLYADSNRFTEAIGYYEDLGFVLSAIFPNNQGHFPDMLEMDCVMYRPSQSA
jgi:FkbM family methyltransferase